MFFRAKLGHGLLSGDYSVPPPEGADNKVMVGTGRYVDTCQVKAPNISTIEHLQEVIQLHVYKSIFL